MTTQTKSFTATGTSTPVLVRTGESASYSLSGTFVATLRLERSSSGGAAWQTVETATAAVSKTVPNDGPDALYRWTCDSYTSGTAVTSVSDVVVVGSYSWATKPTASAARFKSVLIRDIGTSGSMWYSDGDVWRPVGGQVVLFSSSTASSVTGVAAETTLATITIPGGIIGAHGHISIHTLWSMTNSANTKTPRIKAAGTTIQSITGVNVQSYFAEIMLANNASETAQKAFPAGATSYNSSSSALLTTAIDTTANFDITMTATVGTAAEVCTLERYVVTLRR